MRKKFTLLLILVFLLGLVPINFSTAVTQNQIDSEVQILCPDDYGNIYSGSGTIIDPKGIILTNRHVVSDQYENIIKTCAIGFIESINQEPNFFTNNEINLAEVKYYTSSRDMDAAILYLENPTNKNFPYVNIWNSNSDNLNFGEEIETIGFPGIGGNTITYTSGDFSGFGSISNGTQNYLKTTATLEHGNSGGAAYNYSAQYIGIPTGVIKGDLGSIGYILSINSIKNWLGGLLGNNFQQEVETQTPIIEKGISSLQDDILPPSLDKVIENYGWDPSIFNYAAFNNENKQVHGDEFNGKWYKSIGKDWYNSDKYRKIQIYLPNEYLNLLDSESGIKSVYYDFSDNLPNLTNSKGKEYLISYKPNADYYFVPITDIITLPDEEKTYYISIKFKDNAGNISGNYFITYIYLKDYYKTLQNIKFYKDSSYKQIIGDYNINMNKTESNFKYCVTKHKNIYVEWDYPKNYEGYIARSFPTDMWGLTASDETNNKNLEVMGTNKYGVLNLDLPKENNEYFGANICENKNDTWCHTTGKVTSFLLKPYMNEEMLFLEGKNVVIKFAYNPNFSQDLLCGDPDFSRLNNFKQPYYILEPGNPISYDLTLADNLKGRILLQVEANGEAYYIYPEDNKRYFLGRPDDAFQAMRQLGLGATHNFITSHTIYPTNVLGKILLDVEQNGEAYYIYPKDKKAYYLGRPADAFRIMRELGLGITNSDLNKIPEGSL
jgi:hypothetical protein